MEKDEANALASDEDVAAHVAERQHSEKSADAADEADTTDDASEPTSKTNERGSEASDEDQSTTEDPGQSETEDSGQDEDKEPKKQRAKERIQQLVQRAKQAEAERDSLRAQMAKLEKPLEAPREDASQEEIDAYNMRRALRAERMEEVSSEAQEREKGYKDNRKAIFEAKADAVAERMPDLLAKFYSVPCSEEAADFIAESEKTAEIANYLGSNPHEANRINGLPAIRQIGELARLEARLSAPAAKKQTQAPPPPKTISGKNSGAQKSMKDMSEAEYFAMRRRQDAARS